MRENGPEAVREIPGTLEKIAGSDLPVSRGALKNKDESTKISRRQHMGLRTHDGHAGIFEVYRALHVTEGQSHDCQGGMLR